jgi:competence protein ComEC
MPCTIYWSGSEAQRPPATCSYQIDGTLLPGRSPYTYRLKPHKHSKWRAIPHTWSLAEWRYQSKEQFKRIAESHLHNERNAHFLTALLTGDIDDSRLRYDFSRLGLQHLLAVSGFHFALVAALFYILCGLFLPSRATLWVVAIALTAYFLFIGPTPSAMRGWLTAELWILGKLLHRKVNAMNILGFVMLCELTLNPTISAQIGFQLSFLSCAAILSLYPTIRKLLLRYIPKRSPQQLRQLTHPSHYGYILSSTLRESISLGLAVNIALVPLLLFHFHEFPLCSIFYNLFIPFLTTLAFTCFGLAMLLSFIGYPLFFLANLLTTQLLQFTAYPIPAWDYSIIATWIPAWAIPLYLFALFGIGVTLSTRRSGIYITN